MSVKEGPVGYQEENEPDREDNHDSEDEEAFSRQEEGCEHEAEEAAEPAKTGTLGVGDVTEYPPCTPMSMEQPTIKPRCHEILVRPPPPPPPEPEAEVEDGMMSDDDIQPRLVWLVQVG